MKILITGNAGMIGSVLSNYFLDKKHDVVGIDNLSGGFLRNVHYGIQFYNVDICDVDTINDIFKNEKPSAVIHCAAYAAEGLSPFIRNFNYTNNLVGSINIINTSINNDVKKLINFSSMATYGKGTPPFKEIDIRVPVDPYGIAKLAVEMDLRTAWEHFGLNYVSILPHNVISPYQNYWDRYRNAIAIWIRQCLQGENITIYGDGLQKRAFSDCSYICKPVEKLLYEHNDEFFNIGSDTHITIKEAAELVLKVSKSFGYSKSSIVHLPERKEVKYAYCDHTKAKEKLEFQDKTDLEKSIGEMMSYAITLTKEELKPMSYEITKGLYDIYK